MQYDVPLNEPARRILAVRRRKQLGDESILIARNALEDEILVIERFPSEEELRDTLFGLTGHLEMQMRRPGAHCVKRIRPRLDRREAISAFSIRELHPVPLKARIEGRSEE